MIFVGITVASERVMIFFRHDPKPDQALTMAMYIFKSDMFNRFGSISPRTLGNAAVAGKLLQMIWNAD